MPLEEVAMLVLAHISFPCGVAIQTNRLANDMWQVKHLNGLTLVSGQCVSLWPHEMHIYQHTRQDMPLQVLVACKRLSAVRAKHHLEGYHVDPWDWEVAGNAFGKNGSSNSLTQFHEGGRCNLMKWPTTQAAKVSRTNSERGQALDG